MYIKHVAHFLSFTDMNIFWNFNTVFLILLTHMEPLKFVLTNMIAISMMSAKWLL